MYKQETSVLVSFTLNTFQLRMIILYSSLVAFCVSVEGVCFAGI